MSGIVLSSSVRQNLLSLQSTADLLATTQNHLSTGKKVNTALDNPTNFFTAQSLDNRASDISNLLDGISNGVQVLQQANTGITSLQKLVDSAKSVANQALQAAVGYSSKSSVTTAAVTGATSDNLLGTGTGYTDATFAGSAATSTATAAFTNTAATTGGQLKILAAGASAATGTQIGAVTNGSVNTPLISATDNIVVNGVTLTFVATGGFASVDATHKTIGLDQTLGTLATSIDSITGNTTSASNATGGQITLNTGLAADTVLAAGTSSGTLAALGLVAGTTARGGGAVTTPALAGGTVLSGTASSAGALSTAFAANDTITVDGQLLTFKASGATGANQINIGDTVTTLLSKIDGLSGGSGSSIAAGALSLHTGTTNGPLTITSTNAGALAALGLGTGVNQAPGGSAPTLSGKTLNIAATGNGIATAITFGTSAGQVKSLNDLNAALAGNNLQASLSSTGVITLTTTNDAASSTIGAITGSATNAGYAFHGLTGAAPVQDPAAQLVRSNLVAQYNNILDQITTTSQDSSFNGINLLNGDQLKLTFNETGTSTLKLQGVSFNAAGLNLSKLNAGTDFLDNTSANTSIKSLDTASSTLRTEASALGSNLSIVQIRQDFSKNLINVLQTGSSNLTLADTNEEAANSQALSTRQSIAVSALALANTSQQSVLQLLR
jgi:hypothetical protein